MAKVQILGQVFTTDYGVLKSGDLLMCSDEYARHLIEIGAAQPHEPPATPVVSDEQPQGEAKPKARGRRQ